MPLWTCRLSIVQQYVLQLNRFTFPVCVSVYAWMPTVYSLWCSPPYQRCTSCVTPWRHCAKEISCFCQLTDQSLIGHSPQGSPKICRAHTRAYTHWFVCSNHLASSHRPNFLPLGMNIYVCGHTVVCHTAVQLLCCHDVCLCWREFIRYTL